MIPGFSKLTSDEKLEILLKGRYIDQNDLDEIISFRHPDIRIKSLIEKFTENVVTSWHLPFSIAPNFIINSQLYHVPMVTEESSVVAAASWSARFWSDKGGFQCRVNNQEKIGQIHFKWSGSFSSISENQEVINQKLKEDVSDLTSNMEKRGGGIVGIDWINLSEQIPQVMQCRIAFKTADSMGANFINSCLERMSKTLVLILEEMEPESSPEIIMAILSNYTPNCTVSCKVECHVNDFLTIREVRDAQQFADKFKQAVDIALADPYRAVTHNKGVFNGMDAVILATANDFRAFEAGGHAYAARTGKYQSLTQCTIDHNYFSYQLEIPAAIGTVGGLTSSHPLAGIALKILGNPSATDLMQIVAAAGMANNFSAIKALITTGIQSGHMRMHLSKILLRLEASEEESKAAYDYFLDKTINYKDVTDFIASKRQI